MTAPRILAAMALCTTLAASRGRAEAQNANATALVRRGDRELRRGHLAKALEAYLVAEQVGHDAGLLLKIAQLYERTNETEKAIVAYRAYLRRSPAPRERAKVEQRVGRLEAKVRTHESLGAVALTPEPLAPAPLALAPLTPEPLTPAPLATPPQSPPVVEADRPAWPPVAPAATAPAAEVQASPGSATRTWMYAAGAAALAVAIPSAYYGGWGIDALSISSHNQGLASPAERARYLPEQRTYTIQAISWLSVATVLTATGIALLAAAPSTGGGG
ncbi:MAG: tetratricopeptide repeat protein [Deltaproteobacteria bacterium]